MAKVTYRGTIYTLQEGESALGALLRGGAEVDFSCRKGSCQCCMLQLVSGEVPELARRHAVADCLDARVVDHLRVAAQVERGVGRRELS